MAKKLFEKGHKKMGGRPKGSQNKNKINEVRDAINRIANGEPDFLINRIMHLYNRTLQAKDMKLEYSVLKELLPYVYPKLSTITIDNETLAAGVNAVKVLLSLPANGKEDPNSK